MIFRRHDPAVAFLSGEVARKSDDVVSLRVDCELLRERAAKAEKAEAAERYARHKAQKAAEDAEFRLAEACEKANEVESHLRRQAKANADEAGRFADELEAFRLEAHRAAAEEQARWEHERRALLGSLQHLNAQLASREETILNMEQSLAQLQTLAAGLHRELGEAYALGDSIAADLDDARGDLAAVSAFAVGR